MDYSLEFEKPLNELAEKIGMLQQKHHPNPNDAEQLQQLTYDLQCRTEEIYANLTSWQTVQVARHQDRPCATDYMHLMCEDFFELHGDRSCGDDSAILAGLANLDGITVIFICQQTGHNIKEKQHHNFGMPHPEGYRKSYRLMQQAAKFGFPLICLIDTPGAFPGLEDEERGQSQAIASNLYLMSHLRVPIISVVIGEGGSGGALAIGIADRLLMLEYSIYTVASPEAAASILWRDTSFAPQAAEAMHINARKLAEAKVIDELILEPLGGAHRDHVLTADNLKTTLLRHLSDLRHIPPEELPERRYQKFRAMGPFERYNR